MKKIIIILSIVLLNVTFLLSISIADKVATEWPMIIDLSGTERLLKTSFHNELPYGGSVTGLISLEAVINTPDLYDEQIREIDGAGYEVLAGLLVDVFTSDMSQDEVLDKLIEIEQGMAILAERYNGYSVDQYGRLLPRIKYWRVGNEVNIGKETTYMNFWIEPNHYLLILQRVAPLIRAQEGLVIMSMAGGTIEDFTEYLVDIYEIDEWWWLTYHLEGKDFANLIDLFDIHIYGASYKNQPSTLGSLYYRGLAEVPEAINSLLMNWGFPSAKYCTQEQGTYSGTPKAELFQGRLPLQTDDEQGADMVRRLVTAAASNYSFIAVPPIDSISWGDRYWSHIGVTHNGAHGNDRGFEVRKPAFFATQRLHYLLRNITDAEKITLPIGSQPVDAYRFTDENGEINILWQDGDTVELNNVGYLGEEVVNLVRPSLSSNTGTLILDNNPVAIVSAYTVGPLGYSSIQEAVDTAAQNGGGIVVVEPGVYQEHVVLHGDVQLFGRNMNETIIEGWVWAMGIRGIVVAQLTLRCPVGVMHPLLYCEYSSGMVSECRFEGGIHGIFVRDSGLQIARCVFEDNWEGVICWGDAHITNCLFDGCGTGIRTVSFSGPTIVNNVFLQGDIGVKLTAGVQRGRISNNIFYENNQAITFSGIGEYMPIFYNDFWPQPRCCLERIQDSPARLITEWSGPFDVGGKQLRITVNAVNSALNPPGVIVDFPVIGGLWTAEMVAAAINSEMENADLGSAFVENGHVVVSTREIGPDSSLRAQHSVWFGPPNAVEELGFPRYAVLGSGENINSDPEFKDILTRNLHLKNSSPCIDAGNPASIVNDINGTRNDMGLWGGPEQKFGMLVRPWSSIDFHGLHQNFRDRPNSLFFSLECYIISEKAI